MSLESALDLLHALVLEDGRRWGEAAKAWQQKDARAVLDLSGPRRHFWTRPRGGSKTSDAAAVAIAALLEQLPAASRSYAFAVDQDQAALLLDALRGFVARTPEIRGALQIDRWRVTARRSEATLEVWASDASSAWGLKPHLLLVDEFSAWPTTAGPKELWSALWSSLPKVPHSRLLLVTSARDPAHPSHTLLETARRSRGWRVSEVPGPTPWLSEQDLLEQREALPEWEYERLHLNRWRAAEDRLSTLDDLRACVTLEGPLLPEKGTRYALGLDIGVRHDATVLSVCHLEESRVILDLQRVWAPKRGQHVELEEVEAAVLLTWESYGKPPLIFDYHQAAQLTQRLKARGVRCLEFTFSSRNISRLALLLHELIRTHRLALPGDEALIDELAAVRLRETSPGVYRVDHDPGRHDDRAISLGLAATHLIEKASAPRPPVRARSLRPSPIRFRGPQREERDGFGRRLPR